MYPNIPDAIKFEVIGYFAEYAVANTQALCRQDVFSALYFHPLPECVKDWNDQPGKQKTEGVCAQQFDMGRPSVPLDIFGVGVLHRDDLLFGSRGHETKDGTNFLIRLEDFPILGLLNNLVLSLRCTSRHQPSCVLLP